MAFLNRRRDDSFEITHRRRTVAQWFCTVVGGVLVAVGLLGFIANASFATGEGVQGDSFLGLEVNGWHNLVHLGSGLVLLAAANTAPTARLVAFAFGITYALVALIGLADGEDVLALVAVNGADNLLHLILAVGGLLAGVFSPTTRRVKRRRATSDETAEPSSAGVPPSRVESAR